jgi:hypothetical protein
MRTITQTITYSEIIKTVEHIADRRLVRVTVGAPVSTPTAIQVYDLADQPAVEEVLDDDGNVVRPGRPAITDYTDLMSANPTWAPGKPADTFRFDDLWHFIDMIRERT